MRHALHYTNRKSKFRRGCDWNNNENKITCAGKTTTFCSIQANAAVASYLAHDHSPVTTYHFVFPKISICCAVRSCKRLAAKPPSHGVADLCRLFRRPRSGVRGADPVRVCSQSTPLRHGAWGHARGSGCDLRYPDRGLHFPRGVLHRHPRKCGIVVPNPSSRLEESGAFEEAGDHCSSVWSAGLLCVGVGSFPQPHCCRLLEVHS